ncbi:MAG: translocation/assembly module TamB domain-containing protein [Acidobacteriota bacterium]
MQGKIKIILVSLLSLFLLLLIAVFIYVRSGGLEHLLEDAIITSFKEVGIRAEIGASNLDLTGSKVTLENLELFIESDNQKLGSIEKIQGEFSVLSYLKQRVDLKKLSVIKPEFWIAVDDAGRTTLEKLKSPPEKKEKQDNIKIFTAEFAIADGTIHFTDQKNQISALVPNLSATLTPKTPDALVDELNHLFILKFDKATATYQGREVKTISLNVEGDARESDANIKSLVFNSDVANIKNATGQITDFKTFAYHFSDIQVETVLNEIARIFAPETRLAGRATFAGEVQGKGDEYKARGHLTANDLQAVDIRASNLEVKLDEVNGKGDEYKAKGQLASSFINAEGFRISDVRINFDANGKGAEYNADADILTASVSNNDFSINTVRLDDANVTGHAAAFDVTTNLTLAALKSGKVNLTNLRGKLTANSNRATLANFTAQVLGGSVTGNAAVVYKGSGESKVDVVFQAIDLNQAAQLAAANDVTVTGKASGNAQLSFSGLNYKVANGKVNADFDAVVAPKEEGGESLPAKGQIALLATGHGFQVERADIHSANSQITASGSIDWDGIADLNVNFNSQDMSELQRVIDSFGLIPENIKSEYEVTLSGAGEFNGRVQGKFAAANLNGHLRLASVKMHEEEVGQVEGDIAYTANLLRVENGSIVRADKNSRADFTLNALLKDGGGTSVQATLKDFDLRQVVNLAAPQLGEQVTSGKVNGEVDLKNLGDKRKLTGTANITLSAAEFTPLPEEGEEAKPIVIPEFIGKIAINNSVVKVQNLQMKLNDSLIAGTGSFNLDTYEYAVNAEGKSIDLAELSNRINSSEGGGVKLTGLANLNVKGEGFWGKDNSDDWSRVNLNATIQGQNVAINGRDVGDAKVVAFTDNGIVKIEATGNILEQERTLHATVDLRDRKVWALNSSIDFADAELGPYLALVSPDLANLTGRATGNIVISGPLQEPEKIQALATLSKLELGGDLAVDRPYKITNQDPIVIRATSKEFTIEPVTFTGEGTSVRVAGTIGGTDENVKPNLTVTGELNLRFLSTFIADVATTGVAQLQASVTGTLDAPQILGLVNLKDVGVRVVNFPVSIARGYGQVRFTANQALIEDFSASTSGGGRLTVNGGAALSGFIPDRFRLEGRGEQIGVEYPRDTQTIADVFVTFQGNQKLQVLSGNVKVRRATYTKDLTIEELVNTGGPFTPAFYETGPGGKGDPGPPISLDVHVEADNTVVVRNNLMEATGSASLNLRGPIGEPLVSGRLQFNQGYLEFRNERHEITRALITVLPRRGAEPLLDLQTEVDVGGYHITTNFNGPPSKLRTVLRSDPSLPETDIVSLLLTGSVAGDTRSAEEVNQRGLNLAQSLLATGLSEKGEKFTQRIFGLNRFSIDPLIAGRGNDPTARVTVGRKITKDLTITYSQNLTPSGQAGIDRIVLVEYRLSNRLSVVGFRNERGEIGFDVRLRKRF